MNELRAFKRYIKAEKTSYAELTMARPAAQFLQDRIDPWIRRTRQSWRSLDGKGVQIPAEFLEPYPFPKNDFLSDDFEDIVNTRRLIFEVAQIKYQLRGHNLLRELDRCVTLYPEAMDPDTQLSILELSAGGCGGAEVAKHYGNSYQATDFTTGRGSVYAPIHRSLDLSVIDFDGSKTPYDFDDGAFDIVACFQAIDAYGYEDRYQTFIDEMLRIARKKVVIVFNPGIRAKEEKLENGFEDLIKKPLENTYKGLTFLQCPSTGAPAVTIDPQLQG